MHYIHNKSVKLKKDFTAAKAVIASALVVLGGSAAVVPNLVSAKGGNPAPGVDLSVCNTAETIANYDAAFPDGTVKLGSNPRFVISGSSLCTAQMNVRIVAVTTAYTYDFATNTYNLAMTDRYPITETSKDMTVKPGAFSLSWTVADKPTNQVLQMRTQMTMYQSSSFDAAGRLMPGAVALGTDLVGWTQTNFVTQ